MHVYPRGVGRGHNGRERDLGMVRGLERSSPAAEAEVELDSTDVAGVVTVEGRGGEGQGEREEGVGCQTDSSVRILFLWDFFSLAFPKHAHVPRQNAKGEKPRPGGCRQLPSFFFFFEASFVTILFCLFVVECICRKAM